MRCLSCGKWGFRVICKSCLSLITLKPTLRLVGDLRVYSFFAYSEIEALLHYKYSPVGSRVYRVLCKIAREYFAPTFSIQEAYGVGIDDSVRRGYSHNGIFLNEFRKCGIKPIYGELLAQNKVSYAGKSLEYRQTHPKGFSTHLKGVKNLIIFDDIITTGVSLSEAKRMLEQERNEVLFALVLCNARE